ncbi:hypothetical protein [Bradyrhizobium cenepequi]
MMRTLAITAAAAVMALYASAASADNAQMKPTAKKHTAATSTLHSTKRSALEAGRNVDSRASADDRPVTYGHPPAQPAQ